MGQPVNYEVYCNLRLPQSLLMEDRCILEIFHGVDSFELVCKCLVLQGEVRFPLQCQLLQWVNLLDVVGISSRSTSDRTMVLT